MKILQMPSPPIGNPEEIALAEAMEKKLWGVVVDAIHDDATPFPEDVSAARVVLVAAALFVKKSLWFAGEVQPNVDWTDWLSRIHAMCADAPFVEKD